MVSAAATLTSVSSRFSASCTQIAAINERAISSEKDGPNDSNGASGARGTQVGKGSAFAEMELTWSETARQVSRG